MVRGKAHGEAASTWVPVRTFRLLDFPPPLHLAFPRPPTARHPTPPLTSRSATAIPTDRNQKIAKGIKKKGVHQLPRQEHNDNLILSNVL